MPDHRLCKIKRHKSVSFEKLTLINLTSTKLQGKTMKIITGNKEIKNASKCIVELYKHVEIFRTQEKCIEKHEALLRASRTSQVM